MAKDREEVWDEWRDLVNMAPKELEEWLETEESKSVGADSGDGESKGHKSGERIVKIKRTNKDDLSDDQWDHMRKVVGIMPRTLRRSDRTAGAGRSRGSQWRRGAHRRE